VRVGIGVKSGKSLHANIFFITGRRWRSSNNGAADVVAIDASSPGVTRNLLHMHGLSLRAQHP
jgi:hypothetical protein